MMQLTKQQVKALRSQANVLQPIVWVGKNGITDAVVEQVAQTLESRELVKLAVQDSSPYDAADVAAMLAEQLGAQVVQVIGHRLVLFRLSSKEGVQHVPLA